MERKIISTRGYKAGYDVVGKRDDDSLVMKDSKKLDYYETEIGRGEWIAETMVDAKEMAIDFAAGVS